MNLAPDGRRLAIARQDSQDPSDIWVLDLDRKTETRFTFQPQFDSWPVWSPDGGRILFGSSRTSTVDLYLKPSSGASEEELLLKSGDVKYPSDWSQDGRHILYNAQSARTASDLWVLPLEGERKPFVFLQTEFNEVGGQFSPDGKWIAYSSTESSRYQVYVQGFPKSGGKWQLSTTGGIRPRWRRDGRELFYLGLDRKLMAVEVKPTGATFQAGQPHELFQTSAVNAPPHTNVYSVTADGQRFLINSTPEAAAVAPITVVLNWR